MRNSKLNPIISFCTDIKDSVAGIEKNGKAAFKQYSQYIKTVAKFYIKQLFKSKNNTIKKEFFKSNLWVPGDALWGIASKNENEPFDEAIVSTFSQIIASIAYGFAITNNQLINNKMDPINIRAASFYGEILTTVLLNGISPLYSGRCLNACGRLQEFIAKNSIELGFIFKNTNDDIIKQSESFYVELPEIDFEKMETIISNALNRGDQPKRIGCTLYFNIVSNEKNSPLLHFKTYPNKKLKGLGDTTIVSTNVKFELNPGSNFFRIKKKENGRSYRKEYDMKEYQKSISLYDLINYDNNLDYLKKIYTDENDIIIEYDKQEKNFILKFTRNSFHPIYENTKYTNIHFKSQKYCILPTHKSIINLGRKEKAILIYIKNNDKGKSIILNEIDPMIFCELSDYNYYYNQADLCIKFNYKG